MPRTAVVGHSGKEEGPTFALGPARLRMPPFARTCMRAGLLGLQAFSLVLLLLQPSSAGYMRVLLRFRMGTHSVPNVLGRRFGIPRDQRLCQHCTLHAAHDERHLLLECPAMQTVRDHYPALFSLLRAACIYSGWYCGGRTFRHGLF